MELEPRMLLGVALSALLMAVLFHFQARSFPLTVKGIQRWSQAYAVFASACLLAANRAHLPDFLGVLLCGVATQVSLLLLYLGLCQFYETKPRFLPWIVLGALHLLVALWFLYLDPQAWARLALTAWVDGVFVLLCLWQVLRPLVVAVVQDQRWRFSTAFAASMFVGLLLILVTRGAWLPWRQPLDPSAVALTGWAALMPLTPFGMLACACGLVFMAFDRLKSELEYLISHDVLTGAYSHRGFIQLAEAEVSRAHRMHRDVALLMLDVDRFRLINDHYGHSVGDEVLQKLVELSKDCLRREDLIGRYGGEEFMLLLPDTSPVAARVVAERIRVAVSVTRLVAGPRQVRFTVSVGIASVADGVSLDQLLKRADIAVALAKSRGRNRVEVAV